LLIKSAGGTHVGRKRAHNEDNYAIFDDLGLFIVADGMGGHAAGEVASLIAVEKLRDFISATSHPDDITWPFERDMTLDRAANRLVVAIKIANQAVRASAAEDTNREGMGTTVVAALVDGNRIHIAHVGDSRAYRLNAYGLERITSDHSLVEEQLKAGIITAEMAENHPMKNIITRALGVHEGVQVDILSDDLSADATYLLCSDGLSGMVSDIVIANVLATHRGDPKAAVDELIHLANENGGTDNITAVALYIS
jgi:protein phosphatase